MIARFMRWRQRVRGEAHQASEIARGIMEGFTRRSEEPPDPPTVREHMEERAAREQAEAAAKRCGEEDAAAEGDRKGGRLALVGYGEAIARDDVRDRRPARMGRFDRRRRRRVGT